MVKKLVPWILALIVMIFSIAMSTVVTFQLLGVILAILIVGIVILKISSDRLVFITTSLLPLVYIPLAVTGGAYISFTYGMLVLTFLVFIKHRSSMPKGTKLEKILLFFAGIIIIRLFVIGFLIEGYSFGTIFGSVSADLAKIVSGIIIIRLAQIKKLRQEIFNGIIFATILILSMHLYQIVVGLNGLLAEGYTAPYFNYNTASGEMRPFSTFVTPVTYGAYLATMCGFLFWYIPEKNKYLKLFVLVAGIVALIGTDTRSAWIAFAVGMILVAVIQGKIKWNKIIFIGFPFLVILFITVLINPELFASFTGRLSTVTDMEFSSNAIRLELWKGTLHAMMDGNWLIGYGKASFIEVVSQYTPFRIDSFSHPHQTFLEILFRYGLFGFCTFVYLFYVAIQDAFMGVRNEIGRLKSQFSASLAAVLIFTVSSFFETMWGSYNVVLTIFLLMGFGVYNTKTVHQEQVAPVEGAQINSRISLNSFLKPKEESLR